MGIFLRQSHNIKPPRWGSPADVQYSIKQNMESIYKCNPDDEVLIMPLFWGLPCLDFSGKNNHGTNHGATYKDGSLIFDGVGDYILTAIDGTAMDSFTFSAWMDYVDISTNRMFFDTNGTQRFTVYTWSTGNISIYDGTTNRTFSQSFITSGLMYITVTVDGSTGTLFVDGNQYGVTVDTSLLSGDTFDAPLYLGSNYLGNDTFAKNLDEVRISKAARTAETIGIFYERPWDLYRRVARPIWSLPAAPSLYIPQIIMF